MSKAPGAKLACLDGLRGLAIVLVILFHLRCRMLIEPGHESMARLLAPFQYGNSGVHLFLVLSGFCLTYSRIRREQSGRRQGYRSYLAARWRRIAPPYYAAMALYLAIPMAALLLGRESSQEHVLNLRQIGVHLLFVHGLWADTIHAISTPFWSLSLEFQFYLLLPLLYPAMRRFGGLAVVLGVAAASVAWRLILAWSFPGSEHLTQGFFPGRLTEFALGMLVAIWYGGTTTGRERPWRLAAGLVLLGLAIAMTACEFKGAADYAYGLGYAALLAATLCSSDRGAALGRFSEKSGIVRLGTISYSLYLTHTLFLERGLKLFSRLAGRPPGPWADGAASVAILGLAIAMGWLFYELVERHFAHPAARTAAGKPAAIGRDLGVSTSTLP